MIRTDALVKRYGDKTVLDSVSLVAEDGLVTGFVGHNGAGKSTLMRIVAGVVEADGGSATVDGEPFARSNVPASTLGSLLSAERLPPRQTARGLLFAACIAQGIARERASELLELTGIAHAAKQPVATFSLGMRQRLGIALALIGRPKNLVLDEPVNGLDPSGIRWMRELLRSEARAGTAVLLSSHLMSELSLVADRIIILDHGRIIREGTIQEIGAGATNGVYVESPDLPTLLTALAQRGINAAPFKHGALVQQITAVELGRIAYETGAGLQHLSVQTTSLEESFLSATTDRAERRDPLATTTSAAPAQEAQQ